jgi:hypothetical protein
MKGWTTGQVESKAQGPLVNVSIKRRGYDGLINMDVVRGGEYHRPRRS